jgi:hypothetical protein
MATLFRNKVIKNVGKVPVEIAEIGPTSRATVIGLSLTNLTQSFLYVNVFVQDDTSVSGYYLRETLLPANTSLRAVNQGEKLILAANNKLLVSSNLDDSVDVIMSYVEIT